MTFISVKQAPATGTASQAAVKAAIALGKCLGFSTGSDTVTTSEVNCGTRFQIWYSNTGINRQCSSQWDFTCDGCLVDGATPKCGVTPAALYDSQCCSQCTSIIYTACATPAALTNSAEVCRTPTDLCDKADLWGASCACADAVEPANTECRAKAGDCDVAETCDGQNKACPTDAVVPADTECRAKAGCCDLAETCDGQNKACPTNTFNTELTCATELNGDCGVVEYKCVAGNANCPKKVVDV